jgi:hypothetical protein
MDRIEKKIQNKIKKIMCFPFKIKEKYFLRN